MVSKDVIIVSNVSSKACAEALQKYLDNEFQLASDFGTVILESKPVPPMGIVDHYDIVVPAVAGEYFITIENMRHDSRAFVKGWNARLSIK